ncbi:MULTISPECIES: hypothetical protein [unclassified Aureimonas]|uniref:hypothetical protein n=1 Tax=unclassified Aureimonas TaxID=2615206 RepID=UPI0006FFB443|nr:MULTISPECIES: hypothetical protein [unclassified Aureimonas]KQT61860.1 hypothetical protein ASG62_23845 [Aureimonas sp. Leaf427]KQT74891.1 hypothetical protein ASG54_03585 [Aureimonas sp. Leaf460]
MSNEDSAAVKAGHAYFKGPQGQGEKGSAMTMIGEAKHAEISKTARLKAAREERDVAQAAAEAEAKAIAPVKKPRAKKPTE